MNDTSTTADTGLTTDGWSTSGDVHGGDVLTVAGSSKP